MKRSAKIRLGILLGLAGAALAFGWFFRMSVVIGQSMEPTLKQWDYCLSLRTRPYQPRRGDVVTFRTANDPPLYFVKRVVGLPGETVAVERGVVTINGQPLAEPYTSINPGWVIDPTPVPAGKVFVLSDHRDSLLDAYQGQGLIAVRLVQSRLLWHWRWKR